MLAVHRNMLTYIHTLDREFTYTLAIHTGMLIHTHKVHRNKFTYTLVVHTDIIQYTARSIFTHQQ